MMQLLLVYLVCGLLWTTYNAFFSDAGAIQVAHHRERDGFATFLARRILWCVIFAPFWPLFIALIVINPGGFVEKLGDSFRRSYLDDPERHRALHDPAYCGMCGQQLGVDHVCTIAELPPEPVTAPAMRVVCEGCGVCSEMEVDLEGEWDEAFAKVRAELHRLGWRVDEEGWHCPHHAKASVWTVLAWHWREFKVGLKERR